MTRAARLVVAVTLGVSASVLGIAAYEANQSGAPRLWLWMGLLVAGAITEFVTILGDEEEAEHPFSLATSLHLAAVLLLSPGWAALVAGGATGLGEAARRRAPIRVAFNSGVALTATFLAGKAYSAAYPSRHFGWGMYGGVVALLAAYILVSVTAVGVIHMAISSERFDPSSWISPSELLAYFMEACIAVMLAVLADRAPEALAFAVLPLVAVFLSVQRFRALKHETRHTLRALAAAVDARDSYTAAHSERVGALASRLAEETGLSRRTVLDARWAGRLHDLGKVVVDNAILHKEGPLDEREWELMRSHPGLAADLLESLSLTRRLAPGIRYHHERPDGGGYYRLPGQDLPVEAALIALADSYDAMTTDRPYRHALDHEQALRRIESGAGSQFHPDFARAFVAMLRGAPVPQLGGREAPRGLLARLRRGGRAAGEAITDAWPARPDIPNAEPEARAH